MPLGGLGKPCYAGEYWFGPGPPVTCATLTTFSTSYIPQIETATVVYQVPLTTEWTTEPADHLLTAVVLSTSLTETITATLEHARNVTYTTDVFVPSSTGAVARVTVWASDVGGASSRGGLSGGAAAGIAVGGAVVLLLLMTGAFLLVRRRRRARRANRLAAEGAEQDASTALDLDNGDQHGETSGYKDKSELPGSAGLPRYSAGKPELDSSATRAEVAADVPPPAGYVAEMEGCRGLESAARGRDEELESEHEQEQEPPGELEGNQLPPRAVRRKPVRRRAVAEVRAELEAADHGQS